MRRRELMLLLGGAMTLAPSLSAQQKEMPVIGFLGSASPRGGPASAPSVIALRQGLSETGYIEGTERRYRISLGGEPLRTAAGEQWGSTVLALYGRPWADLSGLLVCKHRK